MSDETAALSRAAIAEWLQAMRARLDELSVSLRDRLPGVQVHSYGGPVGSRTELQGHDVGLEATLPTGNSIALNISAAYLTTTPRVLADVCWDADAGGAIEASTWEDWQSTREWPLASAANLARVEEDLSRLLEAFCAAIERGEPVARG